MLKDSINNNKYSLIDNIIIINVPDKRNYPVALRFRIRSENGDER